MLSKLSTFSGRRCKLPDVLLKHTQEMGKRYNESYDGESRLRWFSVELKRDTDVLNRYQVFTSYNAYLGNRIMSNHILLIDLVAIFTP